MDINDGVIHIVVPGWVWLLIIAAVMFFVAVKMLGKTDIEDIIFPEKWTTKTLRRAVFFICMVGGAAVCILATVVHLAS